MGSRRDWPRSRKIPSFYPAGITVNPVGIGVGSQRDPVGISPGSHRDPAKSRVFIPLGSQWIPMGSRWIPTGSQWIPTGSRLYPGRNPLNPAKIPSGFGRDPIGISVGSHRDPGRIPVGIPSFYPGRSHRDPDWDPSGIPPGFPPIFSLGYISKWPSEVESLNFYSFSVKGLNKVISSN